MATIEKVKKTLHLDIKTVSRLVRIQMRELTKTGRHVTLAQIVDQAIEAYWENNY